MQTPACTIRIATPDDLLAVLAIITSGKVQPNPTVANEPLHAYVETLAAIQSSQSSQVLVAEIGGKVVGTFQLTFLYNLAGAGHPDSMVEGVHVDPTFRSQGIGTQMMLWAIATARAKSCCRISLTTNKVRVDAHRFYRNLGFQPTHEGMRINL